MCVDFVYCHLKNISNRYNFTPPPPLLPALPPAPPPHDSERMRHNVTKVLKEMIMISEHLYGSEIEYVEVNQITIVYYPFSSKNCSRSLSIWIT